MVYASSGNEGLYQTKDQQFCFSREIHNDLKRNVCGEMLAMQEEGKNEN